MKIAVYTIFKNEEQFARRWVQSIGDAADYIVAVDTGSEDGTTAALLDEAGAKNIPILIVEASVIPFRFDDARNVALNIIPPDVDFCICLDLDEVLTEGWREKIEKAVLDHPSATRLRYNYIWSWNSDGSPGLTYYADKIHSRAGYQWRRPVHEVLDRDGRLSPEVQVFIESTLIEHYPDNSKSRGQYLPLMELAVKERPDDDRMAHYYGRELFFKGRYEEAIRELNRHLSLPSSRWDAERAASCRYIGDSLWALGAYDEAIDWFLKALAETPARETYVRLAQAHRALGNWESCREFATLALSFKTRPNAYLNEPIAWSDWPDKMLAEAEDKINSRGNGAGSL